MSQNEFKDWFFDVINESNLPLRDINVFDKKNSIEIELEGNEKFLVIINQNLGGKTMDEKLDEIYKIFLEFEVIDKFINKNKFNFGKYEQLLSKDEFENLEDDIFEFVTKNDKLMFKGAFCYAYKLFHELEDFHWEMDKKDITEQKDL